jgi:hypothetical protein
MTPFAFVQALDRTRAAIAEASVVIDMIDVGGGFPSAYPGLEPPPMEDYFAIIAKHFESLPIAYNAELWCEPGRALSAEVPGAPVSPYDPARLGHPPVREDRLAAGDAGVRLWRSSGVESPRVLDDLGGNRKRSQEFHGVRRTEASILVYEEKLKSCKDDNEKKLLNKKIERAQTTIKNTKII